MFALVHRGMLFDAFNSEWVELCICNSLMTWPEERKQHRYNPNELTDVYEGSWWTKCVLEEPHIAPNEVPGRNTVLGFSSDGVNIFEGRTHSEWPLATVCYNLPGHMRMLLPALGPMCIVPPYGQKRGELHDFQPSMSIFADQLRFGYHYGFKVIDGSCRQASFTFASFHACKHLYMFLA